MGGGNLVIVITANSVCVHAAQLSIKRKRLIEPIKLQAEVQPYLFEQDSIGRFIDQMCEIWDEPNASVLDKILYRSNNGDVYTAYKRFCEQNGEMARSHRCLSQNLKERGFHQINGNGIRYWQGLRLMSTNADRSTTGISNEPAPVAKLRGARVKRRPAKV